MSLVLRWRGPGLEGTHEGESGKGHAGGGSLVLSNWAGPREEFASIPE